MRDDAARTIRRSSYRPPAFLVDDVQLLFAIDPDRTVVRSRLAIRRNRAAADPGAPLELHGSGLETLAIRLDGRTLSETEAVVAGENLTVTEVPDAFELETEVAIGPTANTALEGLYASGPFLLTQCEPEGFRKITWMLDRPDVMARYRVRLEADADRFPVLLSNGNLVAEGALPAGRHFATWEDPFPKPSYLFALVAGDLECLEDHFDTADGRRVALRFYAERENMDRLDFAMASLKHAMAWDEQRFGLGYDLDIYNIVATNDFNMGAMENKSLNIFNSKYVLARPDTATDRDYQGIEGVIAHEYFHNWTGNRVTCRDWFQLSLKEGLTVFRDQEFSADRQSRAVKRIEDVRMLRSLQFAEDAGPMAHPVRPESYMEINNFYTLTVYEKGAEVVRMYHTLLGEEGFQRGMRRYFERHDGQAVTCDDFRQAMADANDVDLDQFGRWYAQAGTPEVTVTDEWDGAAGRYTLGFSQVTPKTPGSDERRPLQIPVAVGLLGSDGAELPLRCGNAELGGDGDVLVLREARESFVFHGLAERPVPSLLRRFSAPVKLAYAYDRDQLAFLMARDGDSFNRWDAGQRLASEVILEQVRAIADGGRPVDERLLAAAQALVVDRAGDPALIAEALELPDEDTVCQQLPEMDIAGVHIARRRVLRAIARHAAEDVALRHEELALTGPYRPEPTDIARRSLRNVLLAYLAAADPEKATARALAQYRGASNMTDRLAALRVLLHEGLDGAEEALQDFADRFATDALVMDKWFIVQATIPRAGTLARVRDLMSHPAFSLKNPNKVRSLLGAFSRNLVAFHAADGSGYRFLADQVLALDALNPQVAARLAGAFNPWRRLTTDLRSLAQAELERLRSAGPLSPDVNEIVSKALAAGEAA